MLVGAERRERIEPLLGCAMLVELLLFLLGRDPDLRLHRGIRDHDEVPGLEIRPARRRAASADAIVDQLGVHGPVGELADRAPTIELGVEVGSATTHLVSGQFAIAGQRDELRFGHGFLGKGASAEERLHSSRHDCIRKPARS